MERGERGFMSDGEPTYDELTSETQAPMDSHQELVGGLDDPAANEVSEEFVGQWNTLSAPPTGRRERSSWLGGIC